VNTVSDIVVKHSLAYLCMQKWFTGDVPYYMQIWRDQLLTNVFKNANFQSICAHCALAITPIKNR